ncbi:DUF1642 domain-containing protein [Enterococcus innesii]|uniref:DUF1642 domain-containing protein n=1 Tax=Enterococcus innesii TaxID=2839759 RepID=UPI00233146D4|nr:DUF1642 domain-containing protein [Enterococcus innesii]MDC0750062.1 DUF1642 domain-containing protein [Enterococcus innesii]MDC0774149.1 DUF1642 domain-containing protein [Enterococcus innesii]MDC0778707.1 DUF1642 domain-containing protein [Enterococcus innesii]MDC0780903.1 DUF1642 domain-containing protein [Enterococcus innesii]
MNKQELTEMVKNAEVVAQEGINLILRYKDEDSDYQRGQRNAYRDVATWIEKFDEQPKVSVPQFVASWIEHCKENATLTDCLKGYYEISVGEGASSEDFQNWVVDNENDELTAKAWMFGYEVEKEPKFIVKVGNLYLIEPLGDTYDSTIRTTWNHKNAYKFTIYDMAQTHANKFGGEVEEVK